MRVKSQRSSSPSSAPASSTVGLWAGRLGPRSPLPNISKRDKPTSERSTEASVWVEQSFSVIRARISLADGRLEIQSVLNVPEDAAGNINHGEPRLSTSNDLSGLPASRQMPEREVSRMGGFCGASPERWWSQRIWPWACQSAVRLV